MKKNATIIIFVFICLYIFLNLPYVIHSIKISKLIRHGVYYTPEVREYMRDTAEVRIRGCTAVSKTMFLYCSDIISNWALGSFSNLIDEQINSTNMPETSEP